MERIAKFFTSMNAVSWDGILKGLIALGFALWLGTEGREVWLDSESQDMDILQRDLMVSTVTKLGAQETREERQDTAISEIQSAFSEAVHSQQLLKLELELRTQHLEDLITRP